MMKLGCLLIILSLSLIQCSLISPEELYITPNTSCPVHTCITLPQFSQRAESILKLNRNLTLIFLTGNHILNSSLNIKNVHGFVAIPYYDSQSMSGVVVNIYCERSVRLEFNAIHNGLFHGIHLAGCEELVFINIKNLMLRNVMHSSSKGLVLTYVNSDIMDCSFNTHFGTHSSNKTIYGGAVVAYHSNASISNSTFEANYAEQGGAVYLDFESNITILNSTFVRNQGRTGGVIFSSTKCTLVIENSTFTDNSAAVSGGVIYAVNGSVNIRQCTFIANQAKNFGGALHVNNVVLTIEECNFNKNVAMDNKNETSITMIMSGCEFFQHTPTLLYSDDAIKSSHHLTSTGFGGAIAGIASSISFSKLIMFEQNVALFGGAVYFQESRLGIYTKAINFISNIAAHSGGALFLDSSNIICSEKCSLKLENNTARMNGGGTFAMASSFIIDQDESCVVQFTDNRAEKGGGAYFEDNSFFVLIMDSSLYPVHALNFISNKAQVGRALFVSGNTLSTTCSFPIIRQAGSLLLTESDIRRTRHRECERDCSKLACDYHFDEDIDTLNNFFDASLSSISVEVNVCFCINDYPNCSYQHPSIYVKKGQEFTTSVAVVDFDNTSINSSIRAYLSPEAGLAIGQMTQVINSSCTDLVYNIYSPHDSELLTLMFADSGYKSYDKRNLHIQFLPCTCPIGFQRSSEQSNCDCVCDPKLFQYISGCNLKTQSIVRATDAWLAYENDSLSKSGYIIYPNCPYAYCLPATQHSEINLNIHNGSNAQCDLSRAGILCGSCLPGYSLSLGSSNCIQCMHYWPAICVIITIVAFLAGFALLFILNVLDLTVKGGTINGLIFYANIVHAFRSTFIPFKQTSFASVFISWLNLELGIDTCFFEGMDAYSKIWIQFLFPVYVIFLQILIIKCAVKCCTRSQLCRYFHKMMSNSGPVLATVIFMSLTTLMKPAYKAISFAVITYPDGSTRTVWLPDGNIPYFQGKHIVIFLLGIFIFLLGLTYTLYTLIGSRLFNRLCLSVRYTLRLYFQLCEYYRTPYSNKLQFWSGFLMLLRIVLLLISTISRGYGQNSQITMISIVIATSFIILLRTLVHEKTLYRRPCVDYLEMVSYFNLLTFAVLTLNMADTKSQSSLASVSVSVAFILFVGILIDCLCKQRNVKDLLMALWRHVKPSTKKTSVYSSSLDILTRIPEVVEFAQFREPLIESLSSQESIDSTEELVAAPFVKRAHSKTKPETVQAPGDHVSQKNYGSVISRPVSNVTLTSTQALAAEAKTNQQKIDSPLPELEEKAIQEQDAQHGDDTVTTVLHQSSPSFISQIEHSMPSDLQESMQHELQPKSDVFSESDLLLPEALTSRSSHPPVDLSADLEPVSTEEDKYFQTVSNVSYGSVLKYLECAENVSSVHFVDQVTVLEFESSGKECTNIDHDITMKVPKNAIPQGSVVHFEVAVALYGPFQFPEDRRPISPILWICPQEDIVLQKPIEIILPHVLNNGLTNEDISHYDLKFYKADHTDYIIKPCGRRYYVFRPLNDTVQFISENDSCFGILQTTHCCFLCITAVQNAELSQDMAQKKGYCLSCIECLRSPYTNVPPRDIVYFCTSFFLKTCLKCIKDQYPPEKGYRITFHRFSMKDSYLKVAASDYDSQSCAIAFKPTQINCKSIDFWESGLDDFEALELMHQNMMYPPRIEMTVQLLKENCGVTVSVSFDGCEPGEKAIQELQFVFPLGSSDGQTSISTQITQYAATPNPWFHCMPTTPLFQHWPMLSTLQTQPTVNYQQQCIQSSVDMPSIHTLLHYDTRDSYINIPQHIGIKYQEFGIMLLETDYSYIEVLERQYMKDAVQINSRILQDWLNGKGKQPKTWATLIEVLQSIELSTLANIIKKNMDSITP